MSKPVPNILFLFTDEQRFDTLACYGNRQIHMPHLNALADQSVVFDRAYVTQPLCTPARASIMTGKWPFQLDCNELDVIMPEQHRCLPEYFQPGQYATGYHGKWHLGDEIFPQHGFTDWQSMEGGYAKGYRSFREKRVDSSYHHWLLGRGYAPPAEGGTFSRNFAARLPEKDGKPAFLGETASRFIEKNKQQPWMLYVNFLEPHMPFFGPRDEQYNPADIPLPENFDNPPDDSHPKKYHLLHEHYFNHGHSGLPTQTREQWRKMIANYWGLCSLVDTHVGRILQTLRDTGQYDNTLIVFTSDHGDMMGSHQLLAKTIMYEESIRVPLLVKLPGQKKQKRIAGPVSHIDLMPTLLELTGQSVPNDLPGKSRAKLITSEDEQPAITDDVFVIQQGPNSGVSKAALYEKYNPAEVDDIIDSPVRTIITPQGWKLCLSARGEHELYHHASDPYEKHNLIGEEKHASLVDDLTRRILAWQQRTGDPFDITRGLSAEYQPENPPPADPPYQGAEAHPK